MASAMASFPSALFLREAEVRRGLELMFAGQAELARAIAPILDEAGIGRAHQRALYFVCVGWWASFFTVTLGYLLCLSILGLPLGLALLNYTSEIMTLKKH